MANKESMMIEIEKEAYKRIPLEILLHVADFCEKNNIRYSLAYGTLLGAIRHKGFIPWDDDVDIIMPRIDFEKFKKMYHSERYPLSDISINKAHATDMAKVYDSHTVFYNSNAHLLRKYGLFVDVFVVDNFPSDSVEMQKWLKRIKRLSRINQLKNSSFAGIILSNSSVLTKIKFIIYKISPIPRRFIQNKICNLSQKYDNVRTGAVGITMSQDNPYDTYPSDLFEEFTDVEFEGHTLKAIRKYDTWLKICYGEYMQLPPIEKRKGKHGITAYYT